MPLDLNNSKGELVIDPYKNKEKFDNWDKRIETISRENEAIIVRYIMDLKQGINLNPKAVKGKRGYHRLITQKHRLKRVAELLEKHYKIKNIAPTTPQELKKLEGAIGDLFSKMEDGEIKKKDGKRYISIRDYIKGFKAFWHWFMVYMKREKDKMIPDIAQYIAVKEDRKPHFVYFGETGSISVEEAFKKLLNAAKPEYKVPMSFLFDSGIRTPTEFLNIKRKDITPIKDKPFFWLNIREETAKVYGRKIKLMLCHELLKDYLEENSFKPDDFIFKISPRVFNQYIKRLGEKVLGKKEITMYDFRHNSACYWLPRYKNESALLYRFGWKDSKMIHYYTELLGMKDTIQDDDMLVDIAKTDLQKKLEMEMRERELLKEKMTRMEKQFNQINVFMNALTKNDPEVVKLLAAKAKEHKLTI